MRYWGTRDIQYQKVVGRWDYGNSAFPNGPTNLRRHYFRLEGGLKCFDQSDGRDEASCCGVNLAAGLRFRRFSRSFSFVRCRNHALPNHSLCGVNPDMVRVFGIPVISVLFVRYERSRSCGKPDCGRVLSQNGPTNLRRHYFWLERGLKSFDQSDGRDEASCCGVNLAAGLRFRRFSRSFSSVRCRNHACAAEIMRCPG